jgi:hypothetical protein
MVASACSAFSPVSAVSSMKWHFLTTAGILREGKYDDFALVARPFELVRALFPPFRPRLVLTSNAPSSSH